MSKTLASWQIENYTGGGATAYVRYSFDQTFQDSDGLTHLRGNWKENYIEDSCTVSGTVVTVPTRAAFPTTDDVPVNQQSACTAILLDENRRNPITLFSGWIIPSSVGDPITHDNVVARNEARQELRDRETYPASVIDAKFTAYGLTSAPLATDIVQGKLRLSVPAVSAIDPIALAPNDPDYLNLLASNAVGKSVEHVLSTTSLTAVVAPGAIAITPVSMTDIYAPRPITYSQAFKVNQYILIAEGTGQEEVVQVTAATSTTFTATFANTHTIGFTIKSSTGGIQEAIMSLPNTVYGMGGRVIIPPGMTTTKGPVSPTSNVILQGSNMSPVVPTSDSSNGINYTGAEDGAILLNHPSGVYVEIGFKDFVVKSATDAVHAETTFIQGLRFDGMQLDGSVPGGGVGLFLQVQYLQQLLVQGNSLLSGAKAFVWKGGLGFGKLKDFISVGAFELNGNFLAEPGFIGGQFFFENFIAQSTTGNIFQFIDVNPSIRDMLMADCIGNGASLITIDQATANSINRIDIVGNALSVLSGARGFAVQVTSTSLAGYSAIVNISHNLFAGTGASGQIDLGQLMGGPVSINWNTGLNTTPGATGTNALIGIEGTDRGYLTSIGNDSGIIGVFPRRDGATPAEFGTLGEGIVLRDMSAGGSVTIRPITNMGGQNWLVEVPNFAADDQLVGKAATQTLTNKTLTTPTISSFVNATHTHLNAAGGGVLDTAAVTTGTFANARINFAAPSAIGTGTPAAGTFTAVVGTTGTFSGAISGTTGTFSGAVSGTTGTFSGAVAGTTGTFSGAVSGTTGTFSSTISGTAITGTTSVTSPIHAMSAAEGAGTFVEQLLATNAAVDMNTATATTLFTCPASRSCIITKVIIDLASTSLTTASFCFGWVSAGFNDVIVTATHTTLTGATIYEIIPAKVGARLGTAAETFKVLNTILQGGAATARMRIFGIVFTP